MVYLELKGCLGHSRTVLRGKDTEAMQAFHTYTTSTHISYILL